MTKNHGFFVLKNMNFFIINKNYYKSLMLKGKKRYIEISFCNKKTIIQTIHFV